jgi:pilus assembly protein Flp/PilA
LSDGLFSGTIKAGPVGGKSVRPGSKGGESMLFLPREEGQGLVEYALILVLVAVVVIAVLLLLGPVIGNVFSNIIDAFPG